MRRDLHRRAGLGRLPRWLVAGAALGIGLGAFAQSPKVGRARVSANGLYSIRMVEEGPSKCRVEVEKEAVPLWALEGCIGNAEDLYFISNDGQRFWMLRTVPELPRPQKNERREPMFRAVVAVLYDSNGKALKTKQLSDFMDATKSAMVRKLGRHFLWLGGVVSVPGKSPLVTDKNEVELETVALKRYTLQF